jgi:parvulin-like peptidyl-prolyl isomerase
MTRDLQGVKRPMRSFILLVLMCLATLLAAGQTSSPQTPAAANPNPAAANPGPAPAQAKEPAKPMSAPAPSASGMHEAAAAEAVPPNAAVITIKGLCQAPAHKPAASKTAAGSAAAAKPAPCETVITKKQLETLIETVRPNLPPAQRRTLATQYVELLVIANAGAKAGLEKDPKVQEQLRLQKLQALAGAYTKEMQKKEAEVPEADIEKYYKDNEAKYEEAKLQRIYIPMVTEEGKPPDAAATKVVAEKIQARAAAGEDFDKLQKEAFTAAGNKGTAPSVELGERRHGTLSPKQDEAVFKLKPGEVTPALDETSGYYIYKVVGRDTVPLDKVHEEIKGMLGREHMRESMEKLRSSVEPTFNDAYFGSAAPAPPTGEMRPPVRPPAAPAPAAASPAQPAATPSATQAPQAPPASPPSK